MNQRLRMFPLRSVSISRAFQVWIANVNEIIHLTKQSVNGADKSDNMRNLDWILKLRQEEQTIIEQRMKRM
jgi:hypothetical protein